MSVRLYVLKALSPGPRTINELWAAQTRYQYSTISGAVSKLKSQGLVRYAMSATPATYQLTEAGYSTAKDLKDENPD